jgi:glycosyltransferase involved in cell wall biosynthesis
MKPKIAFVVQRCGVDVNGGAEALCLAVARAMTAVWDVTIITTCARDYLHWENVYAEGEDWIDDVRILRFPVDHQRDLDVFDRLSHTIIGRLDSADRAEQEAWMRAQGPYSTKLLQYLKRSRNEYAAFYFYTYLYATTYFGLPLVREKAVLVPFAHDEWPLYLNAWTDIFGMAQRLVFSTPEERDFLRRRFPELHLDGEVIGVGIEPPDTPKADRFAGRFGIQNSYVLYLGRIDEAKNCSLLIDYYAHFRERFDRNESDLMLFMIGRAAMAVPDRPWLRHFGFVDEQTKWDALAGCRALIMPSHLESLSLVLLEAWKLKKPVLVNSRSEVLVGQCRRAQGGLWFDDPDEFGAALKLIVSEVGDRLGENGRRFVDAEYSWATVISAYERTLSVLEREVDVK